MQPVSSFIPMYNFWNIEMISEIICIDHFIAGSLHAKIAARGCTARNKKVHARKHTYLGRGCGGVTLEHRLNIIFLCKNLVMVSCLKLSIICPKIVEKTLHADFHAPQMQLLHTLRGCLINDSQLEIKHSNQKFAQKYDI